MGSVESFGCVQKIIEQTCLDGQMESQHAKIAGSVRSILTLSIANRYLASHPVSNR